VKKKTHKNPVGENFAIHFPKQHVYPHLEILTDRGLLKGNSFLTAEKLYDMGH
jgi:hypothetical protein